MKMPPLLTLIGATGTGKSRLALSLAEIFNGEIINGDAIQLYKGLPIATNKISSTEMKAVPHHLLSCIGLEEQPWTVSKFVSEAERVIGEIWSRGRLPIVVGGTHYYIQNLLSQRSRLPISNELQISTEELSQQFRILREDNETILRELQRVDPVIAHRWHPNDTRKIRRSLEIWLQTGRRASELYRQQYDSQQNSGNDHHVMFHPVQAPRDHSMIEEALILWLHCESPVLDERLSQRVLSMIDSGLLEEIDFMKRFYHEYQESGSEIDLTRGIWVAIGYKEFASYLKLLETHVPTEKAEPEKNVCIERAQISTRQYAKRQLRWIRRKLIPEIAAAGATNRFFLLDSTDLEKWSQCVEKPACDIVTKYIASEELPVPTSISEIAADVLSLEARRTEPPATMHCEQCGITTGSKGTWEEHCKGRRHRALVRKQQKDPKNCT